MNLLELLKFLPLIIGGFLAYHLIFKLQLPNKNIGAIITYFLGILIVFLAVSWLITSFMADWANDLLDAGRTGTDWQIFINSSEEVVGDAFSEDGTVNTQPVPTVVQVVPVTATPIIVIDGGGVIAAESAGPRTYTVVAGDTLNNIARRFGVTLEALRAANTNIIPAGSDLIRVGDQLVIPATR